MKQYRRGIITATEAVNKSIDRMISAGRIKICSDMDRFNKILGLFPFGRQVKREAEAEESYKYLRNIPVLVLIHTSDSGVGEWNVAFYGSSVNMNTSQLSMWRKSRVAKFITDFLPEDEAVEVAGFLNSIPIEVQILVVDPFKI